MQSKHWLATLTAVLALLSHPANAASMLPSGYLSTSGNQIVDHNGNPVRLACAGLFDWSSGGNTSIAGDFAGLAAAGFNCVRYPWYDATLSNDLSIVDQMITQANIYGIKIIMDHHGNEATVNGNGTDNGAAYPCNGLWYDQGGASGTPGCPQGGYSSDQVVADWQTVAAHYAGNTTVIGFDLQNEPHLYPTYYSVGPGGSTWGDNSSTDIRVYYSAATAAIQSQDPGVLIVAEGVGNSNGNGLLFNGQSSAGAGMDLTVAASNPVITQVPNKIVFSIHNYPTEIGGTTPSIAGMNTSFGFLVSQNLYPVWIGEMGGSLDGTNESQGGGLADEQGWASQLVAYMNGQLGAQGGPTFSGRQQGIGSDWWAWGYLPGEQPDGTLTSPGQNSLNQGQYAIYSQLSYEPIAAVAAPPPTPSAPTPTPQPILATGTPCANENESCSFSGTQEIMFGAGSTFVTLTETGSVNCSNQVFSDPAPGVTKSCYATGQAPTVTAGSTGQFCAGEGGTCSFNGTMLVTFGVGSSYNQRLETNGVFCDNVVFNDPDPDVGKACYYAAAP